ncbi:armadillo repeat-containing protein 5 [Sarotherodon galilaeus]
MPIAPPLFDLLPFLPFISFISAPLFRSSPRLPELFGLPKLSGHYIFLSAKAHKRLSVGVCRMLCQG